MYSIVDSGLTITYLTKVTSEKNVAVCVVVSSSFSRVVAVCRIMTMSLGVRFWPTLYTELQGRGGLLSTRVSLQPTVTNSHPAVEFALLSDATDKSTVQNATWRTATFNTKCRSEADDRQGIFRGAQFFGVLPSLPFPSPSLFSP